KHPGFYSRKLGFRRNADTHPYLTNPSLRSSYYSERRNYYSGKLGLSGCAKHFKLCNCYPGFEDY
ncbi:MAG TPA: hypothetical protein VNZ86_06780, partial [Bacteroidia bacterium]|nr:hypothetical protein [Bacteroidia bacterium]